MPTNLTAADVEELQRRAALWGKPARAGGGLPRETSEDPEYWAYADQERRRRERETKPQE
jgi:hypothetical protein